MVPWFQPTLPAQRSLRAVFVLRRELAFKEAMDRHIAAMETHAAEAVAEKDAWDCHVNDAWTWGVFFFFRFLKWYGFKKCM